jgi:hypothetical protein
MTFYEGISILWTRKKSIFRRQSKKLHMQGVRILRNEAYFKYASMTKNEAQRRRGTFYEAVSIYMLDNIA